MGNGSINVIRANEKGFMLEIGYNDNIGGSRKINKENFGN